MHKSATKCNETIGKWCKNKHGASKIIDTFETYQHGICKPFQSKFSCATFKKLSTTSCFVPLFLAHGDVVVGFAIFHIAYSKRKKNGKRKEKKALLHGI
jgi:hypothetical protein